MQFSKRFHKTVLAFCTSLLFFYTTITPSNAQQIYREYETNDSTEHYLSPDTSIVASENRLYYLISGVLFPIQDFSNGDETKFIRDFEPVTDDTWYVLVGRRNWGGPTSLFKTSDRGISWQNDTSFYNATRPAAQAGLLAEYQDVYQMQVISPDTLLLFVSYYQAGIFYSFDGGQTWNLWFANLPANYRGLFTCGDDYYLWGLEGDGFRASMFRFDVDLLFADNANGEWIHTSNMYHPACFNSSPACIFAPNSMTEFDQFLFFENYIYECRDSISDIHSIQNGEHINIYPNPSTDRIFHVDILDRSLGPIHIRVFNSYGRLMFKGLSVSHETAEINLSDRDAGLYFVLLENQEKIFLRRVVCY